MTNHFHIAMCISTSEMPLFKANKSYVSMCLNDPYNESKVNFQQFKT